MTHKEKMLDHMAKVDQWNQQIASIEDVASREVDRRYGDRLLQLRARFSEQEVANTRYTYTKAVLAENPWYSRALGSRSYHISMATMYAAAARVEEGWSSP